MPPKHTTIDSDLLAFVDKIGLFYEGVGIPRISGRIVGLLLILEQPISPEEIAKILGVSRSSISTNLAVLRYHKFAEEVRYPGKRKEYYKFSENALENMMKMKLTFYDPFRNILQEGVEELKSKSISEDKINEMIKYLDFEENHFVLLLEEWKAFQKNRKKKEQI